MTAAAKRGRPPRLTRESIARAVLDVGFAELTFVAVRARLNVGESTLYRHAPDRDELVRIGLERALAETVWPALDGPWMPMLRAYGHAAWHALAAYPGSATEVARGIVPPAMASIFNGVCAALMRAGFSAEQAVLAGDLVFDLATDNRRGVEHFDALVPTAGPGRGSIGESWPLEGERAALSAQVHAAITADPSEWFSAKLEVVLAGIAATVAPAG